MWDAPKTKAEYYRRSLIVPWGAAGVGLLIALGVVVFCLFIQSPPENRGRNTETDMRYIYAGIAGVAGVGGVIWAFVTTNRWRVLVARGRTTSVTRVETRPLLEQGGATPLHVIYEVGGREYKVSRDVAADVAQEVFADPESAQVLYDPQSPGRAEVLPPDIARLPDA